MHVNPACLAGAHHEDQLQSNDSPARFERIHPNSTHARTALVQVQVTASASDLLIMFPHDLSARNRAASYRTNFNAAILHYRNLAVNPSYRPKYRDLLYKWMLKIADHCDWKAVVNCDCMRHFNTLRDHLDPRGLSTIDAVTLDDLHEVHSTNTALVDASIRECTIHHNAFIPGGGTRVTPIDTKSTFRKLAEDFKVPGVPEDYVPKQGGDHPHAAAARHLGVTHLRKELGRNFTQYDLSKSTAARDNKINGTRPLHSAKDLGHSRINTEQIKPDDVITIIDTDVYFNNLDAFEGHPIVIVTPFYDKLAGPLTEAFYCYNSDCSVTEVVGDAHGGKHKKQHPFDFTRNDEICIENRSKTRFTIYHVVVHMQPHTHKQYVFLCPMQTVLLPLALVDQMTEWTKGHRFVCQPLAKADNVILVEGKPGSHDFLVMMTGTTRVPMVSIKYATSFGPDTSIEIRADVYYMLKSISNKSARGMLLSELHSLLKIYMPEEHGKYPQSPNTVVLGDYFKTCAEPGLLPNILYTSKHTNYFPGHTEPGGNAVVTAPVLTGDKFGVPVSSPAALEAYAEKRMLKFANTKSPNPEQATIHDKLMRNFFYCMEQETGLQPASISLVGKDEIVAGRVKPLQVARHEKWGRNGEELEDDTARVSIKAEVCKVSDAPRGVTSLGYPLSIASAQLGKALSAICKGCSWYDPGKTPTGIAESVQACAVTGALAADDGSVSGLVTSAVRASDFKRMDESHSEWTNGIVRALIKRYITLEDVELALAIYDALFCMDVKIGKKFYDSLWKNSSGSGITTQLNTIVAAAREYITTCYAALVAANPGTVDLNLLKTTSSGIEKAMNKIKLGNTGNGAQPGEQARVYFYRHIGPCYGDDGAAPSIPRISDIAWNIACEYMTEVYGMQVDVEFIGLDQPIEYLSRVYPNPKGSLASYCLVRKALNKLSISRTDNEDKFTAKLRGYATTDLRTPIVGSYLRAVARINKIDLQPYSCEAQTEMERLYVTDRDMYYRVANGPFPWDEGASAEMFDAVRKEFGFTGTELEAYVNEIEKAQTWSELEELQLPRVGEAKEDPSNILRTASHRPTRPGQPDCSYAARLEVPSL